MIAEIIGITVGIVASIVMIIIIGLIIYFYGEKIKELIFGE